MKKIFLILLSLFIIGCTNDVNNIKEIDYEGIYNNTDKYIIVDVRTKEEYESGHIPNSINIPLDEILDNNFDIDKNKDIYLYCRSGNRSGQAFDYLETQGYKNLYNLGGIDTYPYELVR